MRKMTHTDLQPISTPGITRKYTSEKIDILFFQPVRKEGAWLFSNALLQLASFLHINGFKAKVVHLGINREYERTVREAVLKYDPQYVSVGLRWFPNLFVALQTIRIVKSINKKIVTIIGGHTGSFFDQKILQTNPSVDFIIRGDAEVPLLSILQTGEPINCSYKAGKKIVREPIKYTQTNADLDGLHLVDLRKVVDNIYGINLMQLNQLREPLLPRAYVWCGKGCEYNCIYCGARRDSQKKLFNRESAVFRSVKDVLKDIEEYSKVGISTLDFDFDPLKDDKNFYLHLFDHLEKNKFNCVFNCWTFPPENLLESLHERFKEAIIVLSPETFDESIRKYYSENDLGKPYQSNKKILEVIELLNKYENLYFELYLLEGMPLQNESSLRKGLEFTNLIAKKYPRVYKRIPDMLNLSTKSLSVYRPIYVYPLQIDPSTFTDAKSKKLAAKSGMTIYRKTFDDYYNYSKKEFYGHPRNMFGFNPSFNQKIKNNVNLYYELLDRIFGGNITYQKDDRFS
ncbi:B12-binding domain-containing radical SAM protein [[Eubacterium] cellulosolvens]